MPKDRQTRAFAAERVTGRELAEHLGVHPNGVPAIAEAFALERRDGKFQVGEVLRRVHRIEPVALPACLASLTAAHSRTGEDGAALCRIGELIGIEDLTVAVWEAGLRNVTLFAAEYDLSPDHFRKKLKAGAVDLPPVAPIAIGAKRMYRPLDVLLWCRHRIAIDWPAPLEAPEPAQPVRTRSQAGGNDPFGALMGATIADLDTCNNRISGAGRTIAGDLPR